jgi:signal transduction histidine kinase
VTLLAVPPTNIADNIAAYLSSHGYRVRQTTSLDEAILLSTSESHDAIISINPPTHADRLHALKAHTQPEQRPVLVLIADDLPADFACDWADVVLPTAPRYLDHQLQSVLRLRRENRALLDRERQLSRQLADSEENLRKHKRMLQEIEVLKDAIVRNVSHELKTPLLQVKSAVSLMAEDVKNQELSTYAINATARLETLVKNITLLGGSLDYNPGPVIVRDTIEYARRNLGRIWNVRDDIERIKVTLDDHLPAVNADKQGLSTALQLLMDNALKFSKDAENRSVEVCAVLSGQYVRFSVRDYGIGIPDDQIGSIAEAFYQGDSSSTRRYGGMGIGLAIVSLILERHGSHLTVESEEGIGSTFSFLLSPSQFADSSA